MRRGRSTTLAFATIALLTGCATPQDGTAAPAPATPATTAAPTTKPKWVFSSCVDRSAAEAALDRAAAPAPSATEPTPTASLTAEQQREREFMLNYQSNKAFRDRHQLPADLAAAQVRCVDEVRAGLTKLRN